MALNERVVRDSLRGFIVRDVIRRPGFPLADNQHIFTALGGHSLDIARLSQYIESEFHVAIPQRELTVANMDTLDLIVARVMRG